MNQCACCGRFARWRDLEAHSRALWDLHGYYGDEDWYEHRNHRGCKRKKKR